MSSTRFDYQLRFAMPLILILGGCDRTTESLPLSEKLPQSEDVKPLSMYADLFRAPAVFKFDGRSPGLSLRFEPTGHCEWQVYGQALTPSNIIGRTGSYTINNSDIVVSWSGGSENRRDMDCDLASTRFRFMPRGEQLYIVEHQLLESFEKHFIERSRVSFYGVLAR